jgi:lysophospholipase L1-like esterase
MSQAAILIYQVVYGCIYCGLILSQSSFSKYFSTPSVLLRVLVFLILFSGFFAPYFFSILRIKLSGRHYLLTFFLLLALYSACSVIYYARLFNEDRFSWYHSFLQTKPIEGAYAIPKPPHVFRILCLGGSTTAGEIGAETYPAILEELLSARYQGNTIEVINGGHFLYSSQHSIIEYLFTMKDLKPDVIIFFEAVNDFITSFTSPPFSSAPFRKDYGHFVGWLANLRYPRSFEQFLAQFLYMDLRNPAPKPAPFSDFKSLPSFERNIETLIRIAKADDIVLILANQPHCFSKNNDSDINFLGFPKPFLINAGEYADEKSWHDAMSTYNKSMHDTAEKFSIPFVNQEEAFRGKKNFFKDSVHTTSEGNRLRAQLFFDTIVDLDVIKQDHQQ